MWEGRGALLQQLTRTLPFPSPSPSEDGAVLSRLAAVDRAFADSVHVAAAFLQRCALRALADAQHALTIASRMLARSAEASTDAVVELVTKVGRALLPPLRRLALPLLHHSPAAASGAVPLRGSSRGCAWDPPPRLYCVKPP